MADVERLWRQRHTHETSQIGSGTSGTATYSLDAQRWIFLNQSYGLHQDGQHDSTYQSSDIIEIVGEPESVVPAQTPSSAVPGKASRKSSYEAAVPSSVLQEANGSTTNIRSTHDCRIAFGSASWLGVDGVDSGNLSYPVTAFAAGPDGGELRVSCMGRRTILYDTEDGIRSELTLPRISENKGSTWRSGERIDQLVLSGASTSTSGGGFLAVRLLSRTCIFEPLIRRDTSAGRQGGSIDLYRVLTLPISVTGGCIHSDIAFDPQNQKRFAIIDVEGNWSIWSIRGQRAYNARVLYKARLDESGKIFSWNSKKRPEKIEPYFDGWHRVLWSSSDGIHPDRILVCNRQELRIFDTNSEQVCSVDVRLNTRKVEAEILDINTGPCISTFFVLTTSHVLCFDTARHDWKLHGHPALLCSWQHARNAYNASLQLTITCNSSRVLITLFSSRCNWLTVHELLYSNADKTLITASMPMIVPWPDDVVVSEVSSVITAVSEVKGRGTVPSMIQMVIQFKDLSVSVIDAVITASADNGYSEEMLTMRLPPTKSNLLKSAPYVDNSDSEDDLIGFVADSAEEDLELEQDTTISFQTHAQDTSLNYSKQDLSRTLTALQTMQETQSAREAPNITTALTNFKREINSAEFSTAFDEFVNLASLLDEIRVEDVEHDSTVIEDVINRVDTSPVDLVVQTCSEKHTTLAEIYEENFQRHVTNLSSDLPDRSKVHRERLVREIALDQRFASQIMGRAAVVHIQPNYNSQESFVDEGAIFSDPAVPTEHSQVRVPTISASQPQHVQDGVVDHEAKRAQSQDLSDAISRLSRYSKIGETLRYNILTDDDTSSRVQSLLCHLPNDANADPNQYDWQESEFASVVGKAGHDPGGKDQKHRKAKSAAALRQMSTETRQVDSALPLRTISALPAISEMAGGGQRTLHAETQPMMLHSDDPDQSIGQRGHDAAQAVFASTQPVRGLHGNRLDPTRDKARKKRRLAGF